MSEDLFAVRGRTYVIPGGGSGLGLAVAQGLAAQGARVAIGSRDPAKVRGAVDAIVEQGGDCSGFSIDVGDPASVSAAIAEVHRTFGRIDGVVNAAGITKRVATMEMAFADWDAIIRTNLTGTFLVCQAAGRIMREHGGGAIVNIASLTSFMPFYEVGAYSASKGGVATLTQSLANDWAQHNIRVNAIAPGVFPTPLNRALIEGTPRGDFLKSHTPLGRFGDPKELVGTAVYLLSDAASYVTGAVIPVDGGFLTRGVGC